MMYFIYILICVTLIGGSLNATLDPLSLTAGDVFLTKDNITLVSVIFTPFLFENYYYFFIFFFLFHRALFYVKKRILWKIRDLHAANEINVIMAEIQADKSASISANYLNRERGYSYRSEEADTLERKMKKLYRKRVDYKFEKNIDSMKKTYSRMKVLLFFSFFILAGVGILSIIPVLDNTKYFLVAGILPLFFGFGGFAAKIYEELLPVSGLMILFYLVIFYFNIEQFTRIWPLPISSFLTGVILGVIADFIASKMKLYDLEV